jgi:hypothetical protein
MPEAPVTITSQRLAIVASSSACLWQAEITDASGGVRKTLPQQLPLSLSPHFLYLNSDLLKNELDIIMG